MRENETILALVQARMASTRLPRKVLADIGGKPMLQRVIERARAAALVDNVILATTEDEDDAQLADLARSLDIDVYRGSRDDVLDRYYHAAQRFEANVIVRVTADCPLMDPQIIDLAVATFLKGDYDHVSTAYPVATFPDGLDVWVFSFAALEKAWTEASLPSDREHVTTYMWNNPDRFRLCNISNPKDLSTMRWTVDEQRDLEFVRQVYSHLDDGTGRIFGMGEVLELIERHPDLSRINLGISRDEGYQKSLEEDWADRPT